MEETAMILLFHDKNWPQLKRAAANRTLVILPVGATEEHGKHLPVNTDTVIAERMAVVAAEKICGEVPVLVLPAIWTGYTAAQLKEWPGTVTIKPKTLIDLLSDVLESLV